MLVYLLICLKFVSVISYRNLNDPEYYRFLPKKYFDLSYSFNSDTVYFPGQKQFTLNKDYDKVQKYGFTYSSYSFTMGEHGGTHIDAPFHFNTAGWTVDQIPASNLIDVPAVIIDVENVVNGMENPSDFVLQERHIIEHERSNGMIPSGAVVFIYFGWSKYWPDKLTYLGSTDTDGEAALQFPGVSESAAKWLANERQISGIGVDTASIDAGFAKNFPAHVELAQRQIYILENVANLHLLLSVTKNNCYFHVFVLPLKIIGATGSPARILGYCR